MREGPRTDGRTQAAVCCRKVKAMFSQRDSIKMIQAAAAQKGRMKMFSIVYDELKKRYKVKQTALLKEAERKNIYGTYHNMFEAKRVMKYVEKHLKANEGSVNQWQTIRT